MSKREGKDENGVRWLADADELVWLTTGNRAPYTVTYYTPTQARELAKALNDLADELDGGAK